MKNELFQEMLFHSPLLCLLAPKQSKIGQISGSNLLQGHLDSLTLPVLSQEPAWGLGEKPVEWDKGKADEGDGESQGPPVLYQEPNKSK